jgi:hypothetical protein
MSASTEMIFPCKPRRVQYKEYSPGSAAPPSGSYSHLFRTGISDHCSFHHGLSKWAVMGSWWKCDVFPAKYLLSNLYLKCLFFTHSLLPSTLQLLYVVNFKMRYQMDTFFVVLRCLFVCCFFVCLLFFFLFFFFLCLYNVHTTILCVCFFFFTFCKTLEPYVLKLKRKNNKDVFFLFTS